jgi:dCMP deaminase
MKCQSKALIAYVASPHDGYLKLFRKYAGASLYVLGNEFAQDFVAIIRHLPGNNPEDSCRMIEALDIFAGVSVLTQENLAEALKFTTLVMPDEDIAHAFAETHLAGRDVTFDGTWRLRWDWNTSTYHRRPECETTISKSDFDRALMGEAGRQAERSPDWWRQIGALLVRDGEVLLASYNQHFPSEQTAYLLGDPRSNFEPGQCIDSSLALHAEVGLFTEAAKRGICTADCDLYVTTFPCPPCANAAANAGIKRLYYRDGYSLVAGAEALLSRGVRIIRVE